MYVSDYLLNLVIKTITVEYSGTHCPDPKNPLYGRCAYYRLYTPGGGFACKLTFPVKSLNPKQATLDRLFKAELKRRFEAIHERLDTDHYGQMSVVWRDPSGVRVLLKHLEGKYYQFVERDLERGAS
jgi:hypothetical protein